MAFDDNDPLAEQRRRLANALRTGVAENPDQLAQDRAEAMRRGMTVATYRAMRTANQPIPPVGLEDLPETSPALTGFLSVPGNAAVAHDDTEQLSLVEQNLRRYSALNRGRSLREYSAPSGPMQWLEGLGTDFREGFSAAKAGLQMQTEDFLDGLGFEISRDQYGRSAGQYQYRAAQGQMELSRPTIDNPILSGVYGGLSSVAQTAPGVAISVAARNPAPALAAIGLQTESSAYGKYRDRGASVNEALLGGVGEGAVEVATELIPMGFIAKNFGDTGFKSFVAGLLARDLPTEQVATFAQDALDTAIANPDKTWAEFWAERPEAAGQTAIATLTQSGLMSALSAGVGAAARRADAEGQAAQQGEAAGEAFDRLREASEASKLRERDPITFQQFVDAASEDSELTDIYVDAATFAQTLETAGVPLEEIVDKIPALAEQLPAALSSGGDLRLTPGEFAAHIVGTDAAQPLIDHLKANDPFNMSRAQSAEYMQSEGEALQAEIATVAQEALAAEDARASTARVQENLTGQLNAAGRFTPDVNAAYATLPTAFYETMGRRLGLTAEQMAERYQLRVAADLPGTPGRTVMDQGEEIELVHYSTQPGLTAADPATWGQNAVATTRDERQRKGKAPDRVYFGERGRYQKERVLEATSPFEYRARARAADIYDLDADPMNLRPAGERDADNASAYEAAILAAGFKGWRAGAYGGTVALFESLPLEQVGPVRTADDAAAVAERERELRRAWTVDAITNNKPFTGAPDFRARAVEELFPDRVFAQREITPEAASAKAEQLAETIPGLKGILPYLTTDEKAKLRKDTAAKITGLIDNFPDAEEMAAVAYSGRAKRGWYENSATAIRDIFGAADAPRFAALLAALSPQTSVEANAFNALATWTNWINAGRPTDHRAIVKIMGESVQGGGTEASVLNAWINNSVSALTVENPNDIVLSGPKVNSFMMNLIGVVDEVTNDAWMANYALVEQSVFKKTGPVPGKGPGYIAMNAVARKAAEIVSAKTGEDWSAAEVQETVWSWAKTLYEMRDAKGEKRTAPEILAAGGLTADDIASTPDFAVLFVDGVFRRILEAGGYGAELDALDARGQPARRDGAGSTDPRSVEGTGFDEGDFGRYVDQAAARLEELRNRRRETEAPAQLSLFAQGPVEAPLEGQPQTVNIPGRGRTVFGPFAPARQAARQYMAERGMLYQPATQYAAVDEARARRIAQAFEAMKHDPSDPLVAAAYRAMIDETMAQWQAIKATGLKVEFITGEDPYAATPRLAILDVVENNHLWVFPTDAGFGSSDADISGNPLLEPTGEFIGGRELVANDVFRIVHDYFGHIKDGNGFRADGEENAWQSHAAMYSPLARRAMTTETRGQNSWVNFGPKAEFNRTASASETVYADQKIGLLPEWASTEGFLGGEQGGTYAQADPFYSALERAVANGPTAKAPAAQWKATLAKTPGVKKEEVEWSGINDWLDAVTDPETGSAVSGAGVVDAKGNITREAVLEFLRAGGVRVEERVLGESGNNRQAQIDARTEELLDEAVDRAEGQDSFTGQTYVEEVEGGWALSWGNLGRNNEDEVFATEAEAQEAADEANLAEERSNAQAYRDAIRGEYERQAEREFEDDPDAAQFGGYKLPGADDTYRELLITLPNIEGPSTHWDEPNVIAHTRFTERTDASGAKVLFLEELQSDWHQKGRDQGYNEPADPARAEAARRALEEAQQGVRDALAKVAAEGGEAFQRALAGRETMRGSVHSWLEGADAVAQRVFSGDLDGEAKRAIEQALGVDRYLELRAEYLTAQDLFRLRFSELLVAEDGKTNGIPDAPFRNSWSALVMKRMIRYAADNGFEKIAWINGNQQNGGQTGGDGSFFYERNLVNTTNDLIKKYGARVGPVDMRAGGEPLSSPYLDMSAERIARAEERGNTEDAQVIREEAEAERSRLLRPGQTLGIQNGFEITPEMAEAARQGFALFQQNRGQIAFGQDVSQTPSVISLLRAADLSTFIHETGHFFLEATSHIAAQPDAPADVVADMATVLDWFEPGMTMAQWTSMNADQRRPYHEKWARGFEAYHFEGRAPSLALRDVFRRFSAWLKNVYRQLTALDVELTDDVRAVMDRMLASEEEIAAAEQARSFKPLHTERPLHMTEDEWRSYQRLGADATAEAVETLETRSARDMRWASGAKDRYVRALQREAEEQRKAIRAEVTAEVMAEPVNRARNFLRRGLGENGEPVEGAAKLDLAALKELYGAEGPWTALRRGGKYGEVASDGLHPDAVAEMFGYPSGEALIADLVNGEIAADKIKGLTDQRMLERYGDLSDPQSIERAANEAVANEARAKFVAAESAAAHKAVGKRSILNEAAKTFAAGVINRLEIKRIRPAQYMAAQTRAARDAEKAFAKDDLVGVATAKRNQLINLRLGKAAQDAQADFTKSMRLFTRIVSAKDDATARTRNMDLVNAARAILSLYGIGRVKNDPIKYMEALKRYDPTLYADIQPVIEMARANAKPIVEITYEEFIGLRDTVASLWALSKRSMQIEVEGKLIDRRIATAALMERMDAIGVPTDRPGMNRAATDQERATRLLLGVRAGLRRVESWARGLDSANTGPFRKYIWNLISEPADRYREESGVYIKRFRDLLEGVKDQLGRREIAAPELGYTFGGKAELYHALLHTGNGSNKSKLLLGRRWGKKTADGDLDTTQWDAFIARLHAEGVLTERDWTFVQAVWDLLEETKPGAQKAHRQVYGRYFDEVSADPVDTPFGQLRGGYVPALTDAFLVQDAVLRSEQEAIEGGDSAMFPAASNGFTKSRVEDYTRELALDLRLLPMHIDKVLRFTHLGPPVRDVARLLKDREFSAKLEAFDPTAQSDLLLPWLQRAAKQIVETPSKGQGGKAVDMTFSALRSRVGMQLMFANVLNTVQQVMTGWSPAMLRLGKDAYGRALWAYMRDPKGVAKAATDASVLLRNRMNSDIFEARQTINQLSKLNPSNREQFVAFATRHAYFMQSAVQNVMDAVTWTAAYDQATAKGEDHVAAVRFADSVIRETQGSMAPDDISRFETGHPFVRMFTQFAGYFNMMANLNATEVQIVARTTGLQKSKGRLFYIYLMGLMIPAVIGDAVMKIGRGGWEDEEEDGYLDDVMAWFFSSQAKFVLAAVPGVGQAANAAMGGFSDVPWDDRVSMAPAISVLEGGLGTPAQLYKSAFEGESFDRNDVRDALNLLGIITGVPTGVLGKPVGYGVGVAQGDIEPTGPADVARGLVTGSPSPESRTN